MMSQAMVLTISPRRSRSRRLLAGAIGNAIEFYDFSVYGYLASVLGRLFFPSGDRVISLLAVFGVFAAAFLMRPIGAVLFGHVGDVIGRERALVLSVALMTVSTLCLGLLPTYATIGIVAPVLLVLVRLVQGLSAGGELAISGIFLCEQGSPAWRGLNASWSVVALNAGALFGTLFVGSLYAVLSAEDVVAWGWRIPFIASLALGLLSFWLRRSLMRDAAPPPLRTPTSPVREALATQQPTILVGFLICVLMTVGYYVCFLYLVTFVQQYDSISPQHAALSNSAALLVMTALVPLFAALSDRVGRKPVLLAAASSMIVLAWPGFWLLTHHNGAFVWIGQIMFAIINAAYRGPVPAALAELFPRRIRCTAYSLSLNAASALVGGSAPMIAVYLIARTNYPRIVAWYLIAAAVASLIGVVFVRERAGQDIDA